MVFRRKKDSNSHGLMALAGETAKMAQNMLVLDKTEARLEKELERERTYKPTSKIGKARKKGEHLLHTRYILLLIVILNVCDCLLVLGELMLDIKYVTDLLTKEYDRSEGFIGTMKGMYPSRLSYLGPQDIMTLEHELVIATISWNNTDPNSQNNASHHSNTSHNPNITSGITSGRRRRASGSVAVGNGNHTILDDHHSHSIEEDIAHGLHKASITILGILVVETIFKIFCLGKQMLEHKLECFDGVVVFASFTVDLVFLKGLQQFAVQDFVLILAFMVPWRIIRVVNSLVVAIMDHEHFRLKLLYKQKKKVSNELKEEKEERKGLEACIAALQGMCQHAGIPESQVKAKLNLYRKVNAKTNAMGALSHFAVGGTALTSKFEIDPPKTNNHIVEVEVPNTTDAAAKLENVLTEGSRESIDANATEKKSRTLLTPDQRRRTFSALGTHDLSKKGQNYIARLAENSAGFIATMNKGDARLSGDPDADRPRFISTSSEPYLAQLTSATISEEDIGHDTIIIDGTDVRTMLLTEEDESDDAIEVARTRRRSQN